jgi:hypothetical protein
MLELKNIKHHPDLSQETECFTATLYWKGKKAGTVQNTGSGGCHSYTWDDLQICREIVAWAEQTTEHQYEKLDNLILDILIKWDEDKRLKQYCKTRIVVMLKDDPEHYTAYKGQYKPCMRPALEKVHGVNLIEIVNERFL